MSEPSVALAAVIHTAILRVYKALRTLIIALVLLSLFLPFFPLHLASHKSTNKHKPNHKSQITNHKQSTGMQ